MVEVSSRLNGIGEYYFSMKLREIDELNKAGHSVINLGIGSPDLPPHPSVIEALQVESSKSNTHAYQSYKGSPIFRKAISGWYQKWYKTDVNPDTEILPLIGSKEGIMHICMTYLESGDAALVPNPGYPTYSSAVKLSGAAVLNYKLTAENNWHPDLAMWKKMIDEFKETSSGRVKLIFLNYPHMPTGQLPDKQILKEVIEFAKQEKVLIVHDNPYSFILNENPASLFEFDAAKEVVIELNSLSKSHNMAGWRVGMLVASATHINSILRFKSNMDSGMFLPVQLAAAKALELGEEWFKGVNEIYLERKKLACKLLDLLQCKYAVDQVGMFVWAAIPSQYESGYQLSDEVLQEARVFITPGGIFGDAGDKFVRLSLCSKKEVFEEAIDRIEQAMHTK
jgi:aspartate/methionine/tyrosine aminotransferase